MSILCDHRKDTNKCYQLKKAGEKFQEVYSMNKDRIWAKSVLVDQDYMLVSGGMSEFALEIGNAEYINLSNDTEPRSNIELPYPIMQHAFINFNQSTFFLIGGNPKGNSRTNETHFFNRDTNEWTSGPRLRTGRCSHTAGVLIDHATLSQHIAVVGGSSDPDGIILKSTELLLSGENTWKKGKLCKMLCDFD